MDQGHLRELLSGAPGRFLSLRMTVDHRLDRRLLDRGLKRFAKNPHVRRWLDAIEDEEEPPGIEEERWLVWYAWPGLGRADVVEPGDPDLLLESEGRGERVRWVYDARALTIAYGRAGRLPASEPADGQAAPHVGALFHPLVGELLEPPRDLLTDMELAILGDARHRRRRAVRVAARCRDWGVRRDPLRTENFPPADDYEIIVDANRGILLRVAARFDDREFSVREVVDVSFDEDLGSEVFRFVAPHGTKVRGRRWRRRIRQ